MWSLRARIITFIVIVEVGMTLLILGSTYFTNKSGVEDILADEKQAILVLAEDNVRAGLITFDYAALQTFMESLMLQPFVDQAMVIDLSNRVIASSNTADLGEDGDQILDKSWELIPIENESENFGFLAVQFNNNFFDSLQIRLFRTGVIISALWLVITIGLGYYTGLHVNRRLKILEDGASTFSARNYDHQINMGGRDEIARVAHAFDNMAVEIRQKIDEAEGLVESLSQSEENLRVTLDSIGDAVIATDNEGKVTLMNPVAEQLTGWSVDEAVGEGLSTVFQIINEQSREPVPNPVELVMAAGEIVGLANHTLLIARDGREYHIADSGAPIRDGRNNIIGVVLVFRDVTEKIRAEQEHVKLTKLESLGLLAGGIAHDFNNLLTALFGNIGLVKMTIPADHKAQKQVDQALLAMERSTALTNQLLTFAKGGNPIKTTISVGKVIVDTAEFSLRGSHVGLRLNLQPDLWLVEADKGQLSQVISNLVINGQQAMPDGGVLTVAAKNVLIEGGRFVQITVRDEGVGISPQYLDKIFDPYFTTKEQGYGLGLASTFSIINRHNGHITVDSEQNKGTTFTVQLPAVFSREATLEGPLLNGSEALSDFSANILVMDDEESVLTVLETVLGQMGHTVTVAVEGQEAIDKYRVAFERGVAFDLVISDLTIPGGMGGQAMAKEILKINPEAKIIVSSGYATDPVMADHEAYGFKGIVVKPYRLVELQREVQRVLYTGPS